jgi:hypothetical protein
VWSELALSPYFEALVEMLIRFSGLESRVVLAAFPKGRVTEWFSAGGLDQIEVELVEVQVLLPPPIEYLPSHLKALPWADGFFALTEDAQREAIAYVDSRLTSFRADTGIEVPFSSYLATATV